MMFLKNDIDMKQFNASHLEIKKWFAAPFHTHPYEAGWASEAIFFVMIEHSRGDAAPSLKANVELSHDGVHWVSDGSDAVTLEGRGLHCIKVQPNFGNWLRLHVVPAEGAELMLNIQIHCKG